MFNNQDDLMLSPTRPYMIRAIYQWLEDNELTPYLMVDTTMDNVSVPTEYIQDGRIVLNIASQATGKMELGNDFINFHARFGGTSREIWIPIQAVLGIYAKENSQGMFFDPSEYDNYRPSEESEQDTQKAVRRKSRSKRSNTAGLKVLK